MSVLRYIPRHWWSPRGWRVWASWLHWRLETYGVYYPAGQFNWQAFRSLLKQLPRYGRWLSDIDESRKKLPAQHTSDLSR